MHLLTKTKLSILLTLLYSPSLFAQTQEQTVLLYNVGFGAVTSAIGAVINKPKATNWKKAFVKGAWQGSIGGLFSYSGKKALYLVNRQDQLLYALPARVLHAAGYFYHYQCGPGRAFSAKLGLRLYHRQGRFLHWQTGQL